MANNINPGSPNVPIEGGMPNDLPPPYSAVVGNPQYGFVVPGGGPEGVFAYPKTCTAPGVYPHPTSPNIEGPTIPHIVGTQITAAPAATSPGPVPVGMVLSPAVGSEPTTVTCFNCNKVVTTRVTYNTAWHTHLVAGSVCVITMFCSLCCLGLIPYCFDMFKDAEHYCPNCNTYIGKCSKC